MFQIPYSALQDGNDGVISAAAAAGIGTVIRGGVAQGRTARSPTRAGDLGPPDAVAAERERWSGAIEGLEGDPTGMLLRYTMSHPGTNTVIVGTADPVHLQANVAAAALGPLPDHTRDVISARLLASSSAHPADPR